MRKEVKKLAIVDSEYNSVSNVDFDFFEQLDELTISNTGLTEISADAFEGEDTHSFILYSGALRLIFRFKIKVFGKVLRTSV